jgi:predicted unusual protein kinase regulating ubiquinone biosynthesis (AarF/ABC1/UbiB family)
MADLFESFDELPVGAASIAQVHRARLAGSGEVHMNSHPYV